MRAARLGGVPDRGRPWMEIWFRRGVFSDDLMGLLGLTRGFS